MTTSEQRAAALDLANQVRLERAKFRMRVEAGEVAAWKALDNPQPFILRVTVFDYMTWLPGIGKERGSMAFKLLRKARVEGHVRIGELTEQQTTRLRDVIHAYAHPGRVSAFKASNRRAMRGENAHPAEKGWT